MKRFFGIILATVLCLGVLAGCGGSGADEDRSTGDTRETTESRLVGTWVSEDGEMTIIYKSGGKGSWVTDEYTDNFTWSVDEDDVLTIHDVGDKMMLAFDKKARDGDDGCWYMTGKTLYVHGLKLTKGDGKASEEKDDPAEQLEGTWVYENKDYDYKATWTFRADGRGEYHNFSGDQEAESFRFKWEVDGKDELILKRVNDDGDVLAESSYEYDKENARGGDRYCWYLDGRTLYIAGAKYTKE